MSNFSQFIITCKHYCTFCVLLTVKDVSASCVPIKPFNKAQHMCEGAKNKSNWKHDNHSGDTYLEVIYRREILIDKSHFTSSPAHNFIDFIPKKFLISNLKKEHPNCVFETGSSNSCPMKHSPVLLVFSFSTCANQNIYFYWIIKTVLTYRLCKIKFHNIVQQRK